MLVFYFLFFFSFFVILVFNFHYLMVLLLLEVLLLSVFFYFSWNYLVFFGLSGLFIYLLVMVCMGGFSISLLVSVSRIYGRDFWCLGSIF